MDFAQIVDIALPVVYVLVGAVLVWFVVELALTIRSTRNVNTLITEQVTPLMEKANAMAEEAKPAVGRVDPLVERLSLTVDAANLELMRVDQILEDVTQITDSVSKAAGAVDTVTSAPIDLVNSLTGKLRNRFKPRYASDESVRLGASEASEPARSATVADAVSAVGDAASAVVSEQKARMAARKAANASARARGEAFEEQLGHTASAITNAAVSATDADTAEPDSAATASPAAEGASASVSPNAAAAQAASAPAGGSPYSVQ